MPHDTAGQQIEEHHSISWSDKEERRELSLAPRLTATKSLGYHPGANWNPHTQLFPGRWNGCAMYASKIM